MKDETRAVMFSSKTDLWETPAELFNELDREFHFTVDVCALPENAKCRNYYTPEIDGLSQKWGGIAWCNPPYGRAVAKWVQKAHEEQENGNTVVMLLPARTDTKWFHEHIYKQDGVEIRFIKGRLKFGGAKNPAPFPSMIVIFKERRKERMGVEYIEPTRPEKIGKWEDGERKKMKPCPFCGCKKLKTFRVWYTDSSCHGVVECASCKCDFFIADIATGKREEITDNEKELIRRIIVDRWNIRA